MTDLPVWLQEVRDRADKATEGPWDMVWEDGEAYVFRGRNWNREWVASAATSDDTAFIAHARTDVPRLVELVGEMAEQLECLIPRGCDIECEDCMRRERERYDRCDRQAVLRMLAKYRGEVENNG